MILGYPTLESVESHVVALRLERDQMVARNDDAGVAVCDAQLALFRKEAKRMRAEAAEQLRLRADGLRRKAEASGGVRIVRDL
jgi:hypothetical protein